MTTRLTKVGPTYEEVASLLKYDPITGCLTWKVNRGTNIKAGQRAGSSNKSGYRKIQLRLLDSHKFWYVHHICWLLYHKKWPERIIDHKNHRTTDNRIRNLRKASDSLNQGNKNKTRGKHKYKGVCQNRHGSRWIAKITVNRVRIHLGSFATIEEAALAYNGAAYKAFGEFAYLNKVKVRLSAKAIKALFR